MISSYRCSRYRKHYFQPGAAESVSSPMKRRFLLHSLSHMVLAVDITAEGLQDPPQEGKMPDSVPILRFGSWDAAASYLEGLGANGSLLDQSRSLLPQAGVACLTVLAEPVWPPGR